MKMLFWLLGAVPEVAIRDGAAGHSSLPPQGTKDNVLPSYGRAVLNFRILPGDSVATVVEHVRRAVDDSRVAIETVGRFAAEPSSVSSTDSESFRTLSQTIRSVVPDAIVAPYLVVVVTDARYYGDLTRNVFRFLPLCLTSQDLARMHGIDERIGIREHESAIRVYRQLMIEAARR
jgi:carboxypeptidase PM20D1